jgi:histidine triad (HIT) family protein
VDKVDLKGLSDEQIVELIKEGKAELADIVDSGICPTCFNKRNNGILYGKDEERIIYEDDMFECFLVGNPRADGHAAISTKKHYKDMMEIDDETCSRAFVLAKKIMNVIKETYNAESVYLCTMCDGPMNHFHLQLIPRYAFEKRGSKNFVKPRFDLVYDEEKVMTLRKSLNYKE